ncbi:hypothetical protein GTX07_25050, partial [Streptomyces sp. SID5606]|nr:hypothetical protein [Streptomyces sp. SID5606]
WAAAIGPARGTCLPAIAGHHVLEVADLLTDAARGAAGTPDAVRVVAGAPDTTRGAAGAPHTARDAAGAPDADARPAGTAGARGPGPVLPGDRAAPGRSVGVIVPGEHPAVAEVRP